MCGTFFCHASAPLVAHHRVAPSNALTGHRVQGRRLVVGPQSMSPRGETGGWPVSRLASGQEPSGAFGYVVMRRPCTIRFFASRHTCPRLGVACIAQFVLVVTCASRRPAASVTRRQWPPGTLSTSVLTADPNSISSA